jgi:hypothetical protein
LLKKKTPFRGGISRIRKGLGLAPDNIHSRNARLKFERLAAAMKLA